MGPRFGSLRHIVGVVEAKTPVTEIRADDERVGRIGKIGSQQGSKSVFRGCGCASNHDGHEGWVMRSRGVGVLEL